jgi:hypothetical protein
VLCPTEIVALAGTVNAALLLLSAIVPAARAALFSAIVQVLEALLLTVAGEHDSEEICAGAIALSVKVLDTPLRAAVRMAAWFEVKFPTLAVKEPLVWPALTTMLAGSVTLALLLESATLDPPLNAGPLRLTVHTAEPGAFTLDGVHEMALNVGGTGWMIAIEPGVPDEGIGIPLGSAATTPEIWIGARESTLPGTTLKVAVAATPSLRTLVVIPYRTQIVLPLVLEQVTLFPAAVALAPAVTLTLAISAAG